MTFTVFSVSGYLLSSVAKLENAGAHVIVNGRNLPTELVHKAVIEHPTLKNNTPENQVGPCLHRLQEAALRIELFSMLSTSDSVYNVVF